MREEGGRSDVWEIVNRKRRIRRINKKFRTEEWENILRLLCSVESRIVKRKERGREKDKDESLNRVEIKEVIRKLKDIKMARVDEIPGGGLEIRRRGNREMDRGILDRIWRKEDWPEIWKERLIALIMKRKEGKK